MLCRHMRLGVTAGEPPRALAVSQGELRAWVLGLELV